MYKHFFLGGIIDRLSESLSYSFTREVKLIFLMIFNVLNILQ